MSRLEQIQVTLLFKTDCLFVVAFVKLSCLKFSLLLILVAKLSLFCLTLLCYSFTVASMKLSECQTITALSNSSGVIFVIASVCLCKILKPNIPPKQRELVVVRVVFFVF